MTKGRPRKPIEQLQKQGNFREDRHGEKIEVAEVVQLQPSGTNAPDRPTSLQAAGAELWENIFNSPAAAWIVPSDFAIVELACLQADMADMARERFMTTRDPADMRASNQCVAELIKMMSLLGLSPSDRARMGIQIAKTQSTLERMMSRRKQNGS